MGTLYYGDNLDILRRYLKDETVDLVYLDPPFNSAQNYNAFFSEKDGSAAASQIHAFEDTWHWDIETKKACDAVHERFWDELQPVGAVEEMLVDQIVTAHWRLRRAMKAESGEIALNV